MAFKETVQTTIDAFNSHDVAGYMAAYADGAAAYDPQHPEPLRGAAAIQKDYEDFVAAFPDLNFKLDTLLDAGDTVAFNGTLTATHQGPLAGPEGEIAATGKRVEVDIALFVRGGADGKIVEERRYYDMVGLMGQLGLAPG